MAGTITGATSGTAPPVPGEAHSGNESDGPVPVRPARQPSRKGTKAITVHFPEDVRRQLKAMSGEEGRDVSDMVAEGLNLLFAKYHKPEIAPRKSYK